MRRMGSDPLLSYQVSGDHPWRWVFRYEVGNFIEDSLDMMGEKEKSSLNALGYGDYDILIQTLGNLSLAVVITGTNSEFLIKDMTRLLSEIGDKFDYWDGDMSVSTHV